jgi:HD-GYP domain-containing protein (c-di-GMP phosphodiesterase class II)/HAMP domain-containing protein
MNLSKFKKIEFGFLSSKVARRIFLLFILCALLPLSILAYFSLSQVTKELNKQADTKLHQANKSSGMTIFERLLFLEADLDMVGVNFKEGQIDFMESSMREFRIRLESGFKGLVIISSNNQVITLLGAVEDLPQFSKEEQQHMNDGRTLVLARPGAKEFARIFMAKALDSKQSSQELLIGEINPEYLWGGEGFLSSEMELLVLDRNGNVLFSSYPEYFPLQELKSAMVGNPVVGRFTWTHRGETYMASYRTMFMVPEFYDKWTVVSSQSQADILVPLIKFKKIFQLVVALTFLVALFLSLSQIRRNLVPIGLLRDATRRIAAKDFGNKVKIKTGDEFEELGESFNIMADSIENHLDTMSTLNHIGIALSAEKSNDRLLELILLGAKRITNADGCALYTLTENRRLKLSIMHIDSLNLMMDSPDGIYIPLYDSEGNPNTNIVAVYSALRDVTINIPDIYTAEGFDFSGNRDFDRRTGYRSKSFLSVPMKDHENEIIGVLQFTNARNRLTQEVVPFSEEDQRLLETLASQAAVALSKNRLVEDFKKLFDSLVELIAKAVDEKSPYTGDHCRRVPDLTMMLAEAVCTKKDGVFKDFSLSEGELYELKVAAMLHDCGKVTTPIHVVDKATRLQTIFDRIYLIDTRFELLKRDAQIAFLHKKYGASENKDKKDFSESEEERKRTLQQIEEDRNFVRTCNLGEKFMDESNKEKLKEITDKYRWINANGEEESVISEDEFYNLTTAEGTITPKEREVLNQHVVTSIKMLESLPYPKSLRNVPKFAEAHHERMDGKGYPRGLKGDQIPLQGRIIAIADIFEALTARERPYKKGRTLMEALRILGSMKEEGHIDPDLFEVFISEKVYLRYAEKYLIPEQIDEVVLSEIPGYSSRKVKS